MNGAQAVTFTNATIGGNVAQVADVPALSTAANNISAVNPIGPNGGGSRTNDYTLIMDINFLEFPVVGGFASLLETNPANNDDVDFFVRNNGNIDLEGPQVGAGIAANTWYRIAIRSSASGGSLTTEAFVDGVFKGGGGNTFDGQATLSTPILFFSDNDGDTVQTLVNSIALYDAPLTNQEIADLGAATAAGIHQVIPEPSTFALAALGLLGLGCGARRRRRGA